ncbi:MAG: DUF3782 domain-containing protein [Magnetococcales bacterium]|nr:DUF3782 domain-containing protein [Magnetococcales bacterium]
MTQAVTFNDVWGMFQEMVREDRERRQVTDRELRELREMSAETDRKFQETDRKFQETDRKFQETDREIRAMNAETERKFREMRAETEREIREMNAETNRKIKEVSTQVGNLGSRWGEFVEGIVAPACETLFAERGIPVHRVSPRVKAKSLDGTRRMEVDLLVDNTNSVVLVEVKSRLTAEDVRDHLKRVKEFKEFYEGDTGVAVMGAVAGILIDNDVDQFAMNEGMFVIVQSGESVRLANTPDFVPKRW